MYSAPLLAFAFETFIVEICVTVRPRRGRHSGLLPSPSDSVGVYSSFHEALLEWLCMMHGGKSRSGAQFRVPSNFLNRYSHVWVWSGQVLSRLSCQGV